MNRKDAEHFLDSWPRKGTTSTARFARFMEAHMVVAGADRDRIKTAVEKILDGPLE